MGLQDGDVLLDFNGLKLDNLAAITALLTIGSTNGVSAAAVNGTRAIRPSGRRSDAPLRRPAARHRNRRHRSGVTERNERASPRSRSPCHPLPDGTGCRSDDDAADETTRRNG